MDIKLDAWTIVLLGQWNARLLSPDWVSQKLFLEPNIQVEIVIINGEPIIRYSTDKITLQPSDNRVVLGLKDNSNVCLDKMEQAAKLLLGMLPQTPLAGIGINFGFQVRSTPEYAPIALPTLFKLLDLENLTSYGCNISQTDIQRTLNLHDVIMNFRCSMLPDSIIEMHLNFHNDVISAETALQKLGEEGQVRRYRDIGYDMLEKVYGLTLDMGDE